MKRIILFLLSLTALAENPYDLVADTSITDQSIYFLGMVFGSMGSVLQAGPDPTVIGKMFAMFNGFMISLAAIIVSYTIVISTLETAQEGKTLGKKFAASWVPLKITFGVGLLVPGSTGYSPIQQAFMWIILQGIGAANILWNTVLDNVAQGNPITYQIPYKEAQQGKQVVVDLFNMAICKNAWQLIGYDVQYHYITTTPKKRITQNGETKVIDVAGVARDAVGAGIMTDTGSGERFTDFCGVAPDLATRNFLKSNPNNTTYLDNTINAVQATLEYFDPLAKIIVGSEVEKIQIELFPGFSMPFFNYEDIAVPFGFFDQGLKIFLTRVASNRLTKNNKVPDDGESLATAKYNSVLESARDAGWLNAGSYYFTLTRPETESKYFIIGGTENIPQSNKVNQLIKDQVEKKKASATDSTNPSAQELSEIELLLSNPPIHERVEGVITAKGSPPRPPTSSVIPQGYDLDEKQKKALERFGNLFDWVPGLIIDTFSNRQYDPVMNLAVLGNSLMNQAETMLDIFFVATIFLLLAGAVGSFFQPLYLSLHILLGILKTIIAFLFTILWTSGFMLGVYMPLVPFIIYMFTAVGWFLFVIEAIVAAPIVALAFASPSQDMLGRAMQSVNILMNALIYPMLMVLGFIFGARLLQVIFEMLRISLEPTIMAQIGSMGLFGPIIFAFFLGMLAIMLANKAFSLIHIFPDRIIRYVGGQMQQFGQEAAQAAQQLEQRSQGAAGAVANKVADYVKSVDVKTTPGGMQKLGGQDSGISAEKDDSGGESDISAEMDEGGDEGGGDEGGGSSGGGSGGGSSGGGSGGGSTGGGSSGGSSGGASTGGSGGKSASKSGSGPRNTAQNKNQPANKNVKKKEEKKKESKIDKFLDFLDGFNRF